MMSLKVNFDFVRLCIVGWHRTMFIINDYFLLDIPPVCSLVGCQFDIQTFLGQNQFK